MPSRFPYFKLALALLLSVQLIGCGAGEPIATQTSLDPALSTSDETGEREDNLSITDEANFPVAFIAYFAGVHFTLNQHQYSLTGSITVTLTDYTNGCYGLKDYVNTLAIQLVVTDEIVFDVPFDQEDIAKIEEDTCRWEIRFQQKYPLTELGNQGTNTFTLELTEDGELIDVLELTLPPIHDFTTPSQGFGAAR